jgi:hypothetical protein
VTENNKHVRTGPDPSIDSSISFLQIITQSNSLISALNTNVHFNLETYLNRSYELYMENTNYVNESNYQNTMQITPCDKTNVVTSSGFYSESYNLHGSEADYWPEYPPYFKVNASAMVDGFFGGCMALDALFASTLDCLYDVKCLQLLIDYFPNLNQVCISSYYCLLYNYSIYLDKAKHNQCSFTSKWSKCIFV